MTTTIRFHEHGTPQVLRVEHDEPGVPGPGEVLLRHEAIGVNFIDTLFRRGVYPVPLPSVPGVEGAGVVEAVGSEVKSVQPGDRVAYYLAPGSYRSKRLVDAQALIKTPVDISSEEAAAMLTKGLTAWAALHGFHSLRTGETVLIQGATSAVGRLLGPWARALGATVIGTAADPAQLEILAATLDHTLPSQDPALAERIHAIAPGGVDVVYEFVGRATFDISAAAVRDGGKIVNIGAASGAPAIDSASLTKRGVAIVGGPMAQHLEGRLQEATSALFAAYREGILGKIQPRRLPLEDARKAHELLEGRARTGALVLIP